MQRDACVVITRSQVGGEACVTIAKSSSINAAKLDRLGGPRGLQWSVVVFSLTVILLQVGGGYFQSHIGDIAA